MICWREPRLFEECRVVPSLGRRGDHFSEGKGWSCCQPNLSIHPSGEVYLMLQKSVESALCMVC